MELASIAFSGRVLHYLENTVSLRNRRHLKSVSYLNCDYEFNPCRLILHLEVGLD